jgi:hypothetical protein
LHQPFREFGFQVLESLVDDRRPRRERGHTFPSGVPDEDVPSGENDEDRCESNEHWMGFQFRTEVAIPEGELLGQLADYRQHLADRSRYWGTAELLRFQMTDLIVPVRFLKSVEMRKAMFFDELVSTKFRV